MDGFPLPKKRIFNGQQYSDTRYYVCKWLEQELPKISGAVLNVSAGGWPVPKTLLDKNKITKYITYDVKNYGDSINKVDVVGDVHSMPQDWTNSWDCVINNQAIECYANPFKAMEEMYRVLRPGGVLLIDAPFNYRFFGEGTGLPKKKNAVKDYWRITRDGWKLLTQSFSSVEIKSFGGTGEHDRYVYCVKAVK